MGAALGWALRPSHSAPLGDHYIGSLRARLPSGAVGPEGASRDEGQKCGLFAQVFYPADPKGKKLSATAFQWFRPEVIQGIAEGYGVPLPVLRMLLAGPRQLDPPYAPKGAGWPVVVFSSGIWGCCEMYTQFCRELASSGAIVVAIEHEDASGLHAVDSVTGKPVPYATPPKGCSLPVFRKPQLERRITELLETTTGLEGALRAEGEDTTVGEADGAALAAVLRCGDPERLLLAGHSFGTSGILRYLRHLAESGQSCPAKGALLLDVWTEPLQGEGLLAGGSQVPLVLVLSEMWARNPVHKSGCRRLMDQATACHAAVVVKGTYHQWISESHLILPAWVLRRIHIMGPADYGRAHKATVKAARLALGALLDPNRAKGLDKRIVEIDEEVLAEFV